MNVHCVFINKSCSRPVNNNFDNNFTTKYMMLYVFNSLRIKNDFLLTSNIVKVIKCKWNKAWKIYMRYFCYIKLASKYKIILFPCRFSVPTIKVP